MGNLLNGVDARDIPGLADGWDDFFDDVKDTVVNEAGKLIQTGKKAVVKRAEDEILKITGGDGSGNQGGGSPVVKQPPIPSEPNVTPLPPATDIVPSPTSETVINTDSIMSQAKEHPVLVGAGVGAAIRLATKSWIGAIIGGTIAGVFVNAQNKPEVALNDTDYKRWAGDQAEQIARESLDIGEEIHPAVAGGGLAGLIYLITKSIPGAAVAGVGAGLLTKKYLYNPRPNSHDFKWLNPKDFQYDPAVRKGYASPKQLAYEAKQQVGKTT